MTMLFSFLAGSMLVIILFAVAGTIFQSVLLWESNYLNWTKPPQILPVSSLSTARDFWNSRPQNNSVLSYVPTFVITLDGRIDRQRQMETLRRALGMRWIYVQATGANSPVVRHLRHRVRQQRLDYQNNGSAFAWPNDTTLILPSNPLWIQTSDKLSLNLDDVDEETNDLEPLTCALENDVISPYNSSVPDYRLLTAEKIAVWHSHVSLIHALGTQTAATTNRASPGIAGLILEDDIDIERDLTQRLDSIWPCIPNSWDIVFLGHCWSNETLYPPLIATAITSTRVHPSYSPKCTHAYAVSSKGVQVLLKHLLYPPFAYSRALDQALAWLILTKQIESYSLVPSVIVQRKLSKSDVMKGTETGSSWKDSLENGIFRT